MAGFLGPEPGSRKAELKIKIHSVVSDSLQPHGL